MSRRVAAVTGTDKTREDTVARGAAHDAHLDSGGEGHSVAELATMPDEKDLVAKVHGISPARVFDLLTIVLGRQQAEWAGRHIVGVGYFESVAGTSVVEDVPNNSANLR